MWQQGQGQGLVPPTPGAKTSELHARTPSSSDLNQRTVKMKSLDVGELREAKLQMQLMQQRSGGGGQLGGSAVLLGGSGQAAR